jgi:hypothetical protein
MAAAIAAQMTVCASSKSAAFSGKSLRVSVAGVRPQVRK